MKADNKRDNRRWRMMAGLTLLLMAVGAAGAGAQTAAFEQLVYARKTSALLEHEGLVIGGIEGGGLILWQASDPGDYERLTAGTELSGNNVTDLAWTGRNIWVATRGGGLTRITDVAGQRTFRQYASNLGSLDVTSVTGVLLGQSERVYYGMDGAGVGLITDGLSGALFTAEQDGLISNDVRAVQVYDGDLFVGTGVGVSRFTSNLFTDQNTGLADVEIHDLALESDGNLLAATQAGVVRWDSGSESWAPVGGDTAPAFEISCSPGKIYVRGANLRVYDGVAWQTLPYPAGGLGAIAAGSDFWIGGQFGANSGAEFVVRNAFLGRLTESGSFSVQEVPASQVLGANGVAFSGSDPYIGGQQWLSVVSSRHDQTWQHVHYELSTPENVGKRLSEGIILGMASGPDGAVWTALYAGTGLARIDRATGITDLINPNNSGLLGKQVVDLIVHPDGPVITLHDAFNDEKVEILVDPANWTSGASWMTLPHGAGVGLGAGESVWDAVVQRRDVVWFAVQDVGVVRWDINGDQAGPDDPLTWLDQSDDRWDEPIASVSGSIQDLKTAFGLEVGRDGSIWVGGNGLVQFSYDEQTRTATLMTTLGEKSSSLIDGLVNGNVSDIVRDGNDHIWVATASGVNRVRGSGQEAEVDTYIDLANYFANPLYALLYSPNVISPLPGNTYKKAAVSADGRQVLISADQGASLITVGRAGQAVAPTLENAYLFPNPYLGGAGEGLKLGGLADDATAEVEIYNLDGQLVYSDDEVTPETGFWPGTNRVGEEVATGMYVVRVTSDGASRTLTLAVVR